MARKRTKTTSNRTPQENSRIRELRARFQAERPSLDALVTSGEYTEPISQGELASLMEFVSQLRTMRQKRKLSLSDVADRSGIDRAAISRIENGLNPNPTVATLESLARAVGARLKLVLEKSP